MTRVPRKLSFVGAQHAAPQLGRISAVWLLLVFVGLALFYVTGLIVLCLGVLVSAPSLYAQQTAAPPTYTLKPTPKTVVWGYYDAKTPPVLRVKSGDTVEIQTPIPPVPPQEQKRPIVYVKHVELPHYPSLARQTRVSGTVVMKLMIAADGTILSVKSVSSSDTKNIQQLLDMFRDDAERTIKTWTFGCAGCPPDAPYEQVTKFNYKLGDPMQFGEPDRFVMDLPDEVVISTAPIMIDHGGPAKKSKKGSY